MKAVRMLSVVFMQGMWLLLSSTSLSAQYTMLAGGSGGKSFSIRCNEGDVLVGLEARYGEWIDRIRIHCATPDRTGRWSTTKGEPSTWVGSSWGRNTQKIVCGTDSAIKGFSGKAGWYVNSIIAACHRLEMGARTTATVTDSKSINGSVSGGSTYGPHKCSESQPAIGIRGKADMYLDSFGLICGYILPSTPTTALPAKGSDVTTRRPTFVYSPAQRADQHQVCINLSSNAACSITGTVTSQLIYSESETRWTPSADLPFQRGDLVYWRIEACNRNGCKSSVSSFRFMPQ